MTTVLTGDPTKTTKRKTAPLAPDRTTGDTFTRKAPTRGEYDEKGLTIDAVIATDFPVRRRDRNGPFIEVLDPRGLRLPDDESHDVPLLDSHRQGEATSTIGRAYGFKIEGKTVVATLRFSLADDVEPIRQRVNDGTLNSFSIGYAVHAWSDSTDPEAGTRIRTAVDWEIREVSIVSIPADPKAKRRSHTMDEDDINVLTARDELIERIRAAHNLDDDWVERVSDAGDELTDDEIRQDGRRAALAARRKRETPRIRVGQSHDDPAEVREQRVEALACRMMGTAPGDGARPFMGLSVSDYARESLARAGVSTNAFTRDELFTRAMHGTSDFPELLTASGNRVLANAYQAAQSPLKRLARQRTASDFRALSVLKLGEFSGLSPVSEHGEIKSMTTGEAAEGYALQTFGGIFSLSRKALINDDLGAFGRWGEMMGTAAAETEAGQLMGLLSANSGGGVKLSDGVNLFHANHGNLAGSGAAPSVETLTEARLAMRTQKGLDGTTPVNVVPKFLLVGPTLETVAEQLLATLSAVVVEEQNPFAQKLTLLVEPRMSGDDWYVFGDPATAPVLEFAYLSSAQGPQLSSRDGWEVLGREFRVVLDFGCGATDHRGAYRNPGA